MQVFLTENFSGNTTHCNTAVQEAQHGHYYEDSLQEKPLMA